MKVILMFCAFINLALHGWSQSASPSLLDSTRFQKESISLHTNAAFFIAGETLLFTVYCLDQKSGKLSDLSTMAYIEIIGENQQPLVQMKIPLRNGRGHGDFFFHGNVPTGNYSLVAYTKWMRNFNHTDFFITNLTVVNPNLKLPVSVTVLKQGDPEAGLMSDAIQELELHINKNEFAHREKITLSLHAIANESMDLSISVRLKDTPVPTTTGNRRKTELSTSSLPNVNFMPDMRGEIISGKITSKITRKPVSGQLVSLSSPSKHFEFIPSTTDTAGRYYFNSTRISSPYVLLHAPGESTDNLIVDDDECFLGEYAFFTPPKIALDTLFRELIAKRYLYAQIENAFYAVKKDSTLSSSHDLRFFTPNKTYNLDDFTRFPSMEDVFREIIPEIVVKRTGDNFSVVVMNSLTGFNFTNTPLILLDGIPLADVNSLMRYDPARVKTISLVTRHYFYGGIETDGIISLETFDGEGRDLSVADFIRISYVPPQAPKLYYYPTYDDKRDLSRIPDFRTQLYWSPNVPLRPNETMTCNFFTGDLSGRFSVEIIGVASSGKNILLRQEFVVK
jgi:hypothetical protein